MKFFIENGVPYLVSNGMAYPVEIKDGNVRYEESQAFPSNIPGRYSLKEVMAKCGNNASSIQKKSRKRQDTENGLC